MLRLRYVACPIQHGVVRTQGLLNPRTKSWDL
jgi:hypothetical protein